MIITAKDSKIEKINKDIFRVVRVSSSDDEVNGIPNMPMLMPPASLLLSRKKDEIGKKKFEKKYRKYLSTVDSDVEYTLFTIGMALRSKNNICFICSDSEMKLGYLDILAKFISEVFGVESFTLKEANKRLEEVIEILDLDKKEKKLLKTSSDDLSDKKASRKEKIIKRINKELFTSLSHDGETCLNSLDKKYAVDQTVLKLSSMGVIKISKTGEPKDINVDNLEKRSPIVQAILTTAESSKPIRKIVKNIIESHDLKVKKSSLKDLDKASLIALICEIYTNLTIYRSEEHDD